MGVLCGDGPGWSSFTGPFHHPQCRMLQPSWVGDLFTRKHGLAVSIEFYGLDKMPAGATETPRSSSSPSLRPCGPIPALAAWWLLSILIATGRKAATSPTSGARPPWTILGGIDPACLPEAVSARVGLLPRIGPRGSSGCEAGPL